MGVSINADGLLKIDARVLEDAIRKLAEFVNALEATVHGLEGRLVLVEASRKQVTSLEHRVERLEVAPPSWADQFLSDHADLKRRLEEEAAWRMSADEQLKTLEELKDVRQRQGALREQLRKEADAAMRIVEARVRSAEANATECRDEVLAVRDALATQDATLHGFQDQLRRCATAVEEASECFDRVSDLQRRETALGAELQRCKEDLETSLQKLASSAVLQETFADLELRFKVLHDTTLVALSEASQRCGEVFEKGDRSDAEKVEDRLRGLETCVQALAKALAELKPKQAEKPLEGDTHCLCCHSPRAISPQRTLTGHDGFVYNALEGCIPAFKARPLGGGPMVPHSRAHARARVTAPSIPLPTSNAQLAVGTDESPHHSVRAVSPPNAIKAPRGTGIPAPPSPVQAASVAPARRSRPSSASATTLAVKSPGSKSLPAIERTIAAALAC